LRMILSENQYPLFGITRCPIQHSSQPRRKPRPDNGKISTHNRMIANGMTLTNACAPHLDFAAARHDIRRENKQGPHPMSGDHDHDHSHDHDHEHGSELSEMQIRVRALESILTEKGYVEPAALDAIIEAYETRIGPHNGAQVVARAWTDPAFREALLEDASKAVSTLGHVSRVGDHLVAIENTPQRHNMVVCTLCSCYPWEMLGLPPVWYKASPYRSRAVKDPRGVLADFGVSLPQDTEIRVWDSTAETRFLVLPMRPAGTEGWSEAQLAELVTRDSMIGTGFPKTPGAPS
jgi:nitrile hydratase